MLRTTSLITLNYNDGYFPRHFGWKVASNLVTYAYCKTEAEEISSREISVPRPKTQTPLKQQASA